ncbi:hypothetical protein ACHAXA_002700 [Cyclostephanos tholiformis]|uniref:Uncharacterized protein n=1 Tax=Cyclostephanos tholiformis TaxID=382380 RepID=A0ABD3R6K6_9STRA
MGTARRHGTFFFATAALVGFPASSSALLHSKSNAPSSPQLFGRPTFLKLEASRQSFSGLDKLKAKRLSIRRRIPEPEIDAMSECREADDQVNYSSVGGLEYLYEVGEERHSDDLYHIILMPSTFRKEQMSIEHAAESCSEILGIGSDKAWDISLFAKHQGFGCLGTWTREECLSMGEELLSRNIDCRVIPFNGGGVSEDIDRYTAEDVSVSFSLSYSN